MNRTLIDNVRLFMLALGIVAIANASQHASLPIRITIFSLLVVYAFAINLVPDKMAAEFADVRYTLAPVPCLVNPVFTSGGFVAPIMLLVSLAVLVITIRMCMQLGDRWKTVMSPLFMSGLFGLCVVTRYDPYTFRNERHSPVLSLLFLLAVVLPFVSLLISSLTKRLALARQAAG